MQLSIVTTLYRSTDYILAFYDRCLAAAQQLVGDDFEIVFVNDGSPDDSLQRAVKLHQHDARVKVVDLSRNFGHHKAMMTGLAHSQGERVFLIDSDLEEEPEWLLRFAEHMQQTNCDVVYGVQEKRKGNWFERVSGQSFYRFFNLITHLNLPENIVTARLMTRRYVDSLVKHQEREVFMAGLWHITGFDQQGCIVHKHSSSETTYTLARKIALIVNSVTSFSNTPLKAIFYVGLCIMLCALIYIFYLVIHWMLMARPVSGWTSIMASVWLLGGMIISFIGVIGIYLSKIFSETKQRPYTIVRHLYQQEES